MNEKVRKVIFITGGSDGVGLDLAKTLLEKNTKDVKKHEVVLISRNEKKLAKIADRLGCLYGVCDVSDYSKVEQTFKKLARKTKGIDCVVHCAGNYATGSLSELPAKKIENVFAVNFLGTVYVTKVASRLMKKGQIIHINSIVGYKETARPKHWVYGLSKEISKRFSEIVSSELAVKGINLSVLYPGAIQTKFAEKHTGVARDLSHALPVNKISDLIVKVVEHPDVRLNGIAITALDEFHAV